MSLWRIAWIYLWSRWLTTGLTILSVALAVGLISAILTLRDETRARFEEEQQAYDIVVGPPGSPLQLVLNAVYFLDQPTGVLAYSDYERLKEHEDVEHAFPIGLGDTYRRFRIVGTVREIFEYPWTHPVTGEDRFPFQLEDGRFFSAPLEAVVGYRVALNTRLKVGDRFAGTHGTIEFSSDIAEYDHSKDPYEVVGVLKPSGTSADRAIFVDLQSIWDLHARVDESYEGEGPPGSGSGNSEERGVAEEEEKLVSAVLIDLYSPALRFSFMEYVMREYAATPAIPVVQILRLYNQILAPAVLIMMSVGYVVVIISALSILIGLYLSIIQRKRDLAIMRALGASAYEIFGAVMIEAFLVTVMGIAAGWVLGKTVALGLGVYMSRAYGFNIAGLGTSSEELGFFAIVAMVGLLAGIVPAWQAYRTDVARDLQAT
ncbi:MAG: ABC transporter permease [Candidatus Hydrogenedentes bacterium]|nr:ABC transporter permease [Candidatus Hydrogenedentota bacterium]